MSRGGVSSARLASGTTSNQLKFDRFLGLALSGGKTDRTALAVLEYYSGYKKLFLTRIIDSFETSPEVSQDQNLFEELKSWELQTRYLCYNVALEAPKCFRCNLKCPGYEVCKEPEIRWLWKQYEKRKKSKSKLKLFTPYTERCAEYYLASELEEPFFPSSAMGANMAPLLARARFLQRRLHFESIEAYARLSFWRMGAKLGIRANRLRKYPTAFEGEEIRQEFITHLLESSGIFIYEQDRRLVIESHPAFEALICALTAYLKHLNQCELPPKDFPVSEPWIEHPLKNFTWT